MDIIPNAEYEDLKFRFLKKKAELLNLITERDNLTRTVIPNLKALYMNLFGGLLIESLESEQLYLRLKRKIELIQSLVNSSQKIIDNKKIEEILDLEYSDWQKKINQMKIDREEAMSWFNSCLTDEESKELKIRYREIVKRLHPDLNTNLNPFQIELWHKTQEAYQAANLVEIHRIYLLLDNISDTKEIDNFNDIKEKIVKLEQQIILINNEMGTRRNQYPLTYETILQDQQQIEIEKEKIKAKSDSYKEKIKILKLHLSNLEHLTSNEQYN